MQAVVEIGSSQYLVTPGMELTVDKLSQTEGQLVIDHVLLVLDGAKVQVGQPYVSGVRVTANVLGQVKGDKVRTTKFKAKSRYDKTVGFRPQYTKLKIDNIASTATSAVPASKTAVASKPKTRKSRETKS